MSLHREHASNNHDFFISNVPDNHVQREKIPAGLDVRFDGYTPLAESDLEAASRFESPADARTNASAEGITRPEDVVPIYRKRTHIDPSGQERETQAKYFVVDGVEALAKFGNDAWDRVVCVLTTGQAWQFKPYKWNDPKILFHHGQSTLMCSYTSL